MAGIDKTYVKTWEEYKEIVDWAKKTEFICPNGIILNPINYCYEAKEEYFDGQHECPVMNTSLSLDYFLIKYCPLKVVQDRLREVYDQEYYDSIKNGTSCYDTFTYPEMGTKVKMIKCSKYHNKKPFSYYNHYYNKRITSVFIEVRYKNRSLWYNEDYDKFLLDDELGFTTSSCATLNCKSLKAIVRKIRKWKLPKGSIVIVEGRYVGETWKFIIK